MEAQNQKNKPDTAQDWLVISIFFWVLFVLIVTIGYMVDPHYIPPIQP